MSFTKHPNSVNETYIRHMFSSFSFFIKLQLLSFALIIHAVFPFLFKSTASNGIQDLSNYMVKRNN